MNEADNIPNVLSYQSPVKRRALRLWIIVLAVLLIVAGAAIGGAFLLSKPDQQPGMGVPE